MSTGWVESKSKIKKSGQPGSVSMPAGRPGWVSLTSWVFGGSQISRAPHKDGESLIFFSPSWGLCKTPQGPI